MEEDMEWREWAMKIKEWLQKMRESDAGLNVRNSTIAISIIERQREAFGHIIHDDGSCDQTGKHNSCDRIQRIAREAFDMEV
jgi:hypothetical protein